MTSVKKNFLYNNLLLLSNLLFPIVSFAYASRILGPAGIGKVQFVVTFATYFVVVAQFGIPVYGMREVAKARGDKKQLDKLFSELLLINILSSLLLSVVYGGVILSLPWFHNSLNYYLLGGLLVLSGFSVLDWFYMGMEQFRFLSLRSIVIKTVALTVLFLFVRTAEDLMVYFLIAIFSIVINNLWNLLHLKGQVSIRFIRLNLKRHYGPLLILFVSSLTISVYTLGDTLLLGFLTNDKAVGLYTAAKKLTIIVIPLITSLGTVLIPRLTKSIDVQNTRETGVRMEQSFSFICLFGIPVTMGLIVFAPEIMRVFTGTGFMGAVLTLQLMAPVIFLVGLGHLFGMQLLIPGGFEKQYLTATLIGMGISLFLNLLLIRIFQDKGAAVTLLITEGIVSFTAYFFVTKKMNFHVHWPVAVKALAASLLFIPVALFMRSTGLSLTLELFVAILISAALYFIVQIFLFKETLLKAIISSALKNLLNDEFS